MVYVYKCLNHTAPGYLSSCLSPHRPGRSSLRSASAQHPTLLTSRNPTQSNFLRLHQVAPPLILLPTLGGHLLSQSGNLTQTIKHYLYPTSSTVLLQMPYMYGMHVSYIWVLVVFDALLNGLPMQNKCVCFYNNLMCFYYCCRFKYSLLPTATATDCER